MSFTVTDFNDFKELLALHPEWRAELQRMIVGEDLEALPSLVRDLVEAQRAAEDRLTRLEAAVRELQQSVAGLQQAVAGLQQTVTGLQQTVAGLQQAVSGLQETVRELVEYQRRNEQRLAKIEDTLGEHTGSLLEIRYHDRAGACFGRWLRRTCVVDMSELADELRDHLSRPELDDALKIDFVVGGRPEQRPDVEEVWLAVEVSAIVDRDNVARAIQRADLIRRSGHAVLPAVAGKGATEGAKLKTAEGKVLLLQDGSGEHWEEALAAWI